MKRIALLATLAVGLTVGSAGYAGVIDDQLKSYEAAGGKNFSAERGKAMWTQDHKDPESGKMINCATCHTTDLKATGKHHQTGKPIEPMAPSANKERFTDPKKIEKWFKRNCKEVLSRECTAQEKGDLLMFFRAQ